MHRIVAIALAALGGHATAVTAQTHDYDAEVRRIAGRPGVRQAFDAVDRLEPRTRADLIMLTEIPAPPFKEEQRGRRYAELLREAGADSVWTDEVGNVIALRRGRAGRGRVALAGHLDTVFPEGTDVTVRVRGDTLFAPGVGDDTRGLVVVLTVLRALREARIATEADLLFIGTVGEEGLGDLRGVKHLFGAGALGITSFIAVDGDGAERIVHQAVGSRRYRVTYAGPGGHSWGAFGLANPHHALGRAIHHFVEAADAYTRAGPATSYNVGVISGGTSVNSIPFESSMEIDLRSVDPGRLAGVDSLMRRAAERALNEQNVLRRQGAPLALDIALLGDRPSGTLDPATPVIQRARAAIRSLGLTPTLGSGSTDANIGIARGFPAITIGRGGVGGGAHSPGEWWLNANGAAGIKSALLITLAEAGLAPLR